MPPEETKSISLKQQKINFFLYCIVALLTVVIIILLGVLFTTKDQFNGNKLNNDSNNLENTESDLVNEEPTEKRSAFTQSENIILTNLSEDQTIESPFLIEGRANQFFGEGQFRVEVYNMTDALIGYGTAIAQTEDWMSEDFTDFIAVINFNNGRETSGKVVFIKDNPSALPENDERFEVNVGFEPQAVEITNVTNLLTNPLSSAMPITGFASGLFFEGQFGVELLDDNGNLVTIGIALAEGDWMSSDYVPFTINLTYTKPENSTSGVLRLKSDNPSGLPENDFSFDVPIIF